MSEDRRISLGRFELAVREGGSGALHFLGLHGLVDDLGIWDRIAPALEARGRFARMDLRGHGASGTPAAPCSRADLADDVVRVLDALAVERTVLVGHSMGGVVAMATALAHPDRVMGLVLIGTTSACNEKVAGWYERIALAGESDGCEGLGRAIYGKDSRKEIRGDAQGIAHVTRMLKSLHPDPLTPRLDQLACPVLLLVGEKDPMGPKASVIIHEALPPGRSDLVTLPGLGHWLHVEAPEHVVESLDEWRAKALHGL